MTRVRHRRKPAAHKRSRLSKRARARRLERRLRITIISVSAALVVLVVGMMAFAQRPQPTQLNPATVHVEASAIAGLRVDGYDAEQIANAAIIVQVGAERELTARDQAIAVMTAIGESSLRNVRFGDFEVSGVRNPDGSPTSSLGLFQQQYWWGSDQQRLNPYNASTLFYAALERKTTPQQRADTAPSEIAHIVQVNTNPDHYARFWDDAVRIVEALRSASPPP